MQKVADKLNFLKMTPEERDSYYYMKQVYNDRDQLQAAENKGREQGREKEKQKNLEEKQEIAKRLIQEGLDISKVSSITGLSIEQIKSSL